MLCQFLSGLTGVIQGDNVNDIITQFICDSSWGFLTLFSVLLIHSTFHRCHHHKLAVNNLCTALLRFVFAPYAAAGFKRSYRLLLLCAVASFLLTNHYITKFNTSESILGGVSARQPIRGLNLNDLWFVFPTVVSIFNIDFAGILSMPVRWLESIVLISLIESSVHPINSYSSQVAWRLSPRPETI